MSGVQFSPATHTPTPSTKSKKNNQIKKETKSTKKGTDIYWKNKYIMGCKSENISMKALKPDVTVFNRAEAPPEGVYIDVEETKSTKGRSKVMRVKVITKNMIGREVYGDIALNKVE